MQLSKALISAAAALPGFEEIDPRIEIRGVKRPRWRPAGLPGKGRIGAVLLMLYERHNETTVVLTKRRANLNSHGGQISLPGGKQEAGEALDVTALRESEEEVGVDLNKVELLGRLNQVYIPPSDFTVHPFIGWHTGRPQFVAAVDEVAEIIEVPLSHLFDPATLVMGEMSFGDATFAVPYFQVDHHQVWGATALMLGEFIRRIQAVMPQP